MFLASGHCCWRCKRYDVVWISDKMALTAEIILTVPTKNFSNSRHIPGTQFDSMVHLRRYCPLALPLVLDMFQ